MERKTIMSYFEEKYGDNEFVMNVLKKKNTNELRQDYKKDIDRDKKENKILEKGTITYTIDFDYNSRKEIEEYMWDNNMFTMYDGEIRYRCSNDGRLLGVPLEFIEQLKKKFELKLSREMYILGRNDLKKIKIGDKVKITTSGLFGNTSDQGTACSVTENEIIIRKYRSKTKGYALNVGDECHIERIKTFQKVSQQQNKNLIL